MKRLAEQIGLAQRREISGQLCPKETKSSNQHLKKLINKKYLINLIPILTQV